MTDFNEEMFREQIRAAEALRDEAKRFRMEFRQQADRTNRTLDAVARRLERIEAATRGTPGRTGREVGRAIDGAVRDARRICDSGIPKPAPPVEVLEHLVLEHKEGQFKSVCGKVWTPGPNDVAVGRCDTCADCAESMWFG